MTGVDADRYPLRLTDWEGTPAMRTYRTLLVSGALAALAGLAGGAFLLSLTRLLAIGDRPAWKAPSASRRRALARPAPAAEPRREAAPSAVAPPRKTERLETIELDGRPNPHGPPDVGARALDRQLAVPSTG
jgi:hypothetical protein